MSRKRRPHRPQQHAQRELSEPSTLNGHPLTGLVVARFGAKLDVEDEHGTVFRCTSRRKFGAIVCGDQVLWQPTHDNEGVIVEALPRTTLLARPDDIGRDKPIAANISQVIIVMTVKALADENYYLFHNLIDRYLVATEFLGITPVIVINKVDMLNDNEEQQLAQDLLPYETIGYRIIRTSTKQAHGMDALEAQLKDQTSVFVGESGVGKSSIIRTLLQTSDIRIGEVSESSGKGKHTTTATTLYHLPSGGNLIDSPGVREFGLSRIEPSELAYNFIEFRPFVNSCRFHNCIHKTEPQCAVKQAVEDGEVDSRRYENYLEILDSLSPMLRPA